MAASTRVQMFHDFDSLWQGLDYNLVWLIA